MTPQCSLQGPLISYKAGILAGALAYLYQASKDEQYLNDATKIFNTAKGLFTKNDVWTDTCEPSCSLDQVSPKGTALLGFTFLYAQTTDSTLKSAIKQTLDASASAMLAKCDSNYQCPNNWSGQDGGQASFHTQLTALSLMIALAQAHGASYNGKIASPNPTTPTTTLKQPDNLGMKMHQPIILAAFFVLLL
jgi:hypothetical protein